MKLGKEGVDLILKEEAAKWVEDTICQRIPLEPLEDVLKNGVVLERLARILEARYQQRSCQLKEIPHEAVLRGFKADSAGSRTLLDISKFLKFCTDLGVADSHMCRASDITVPKPGATYKVCITLLAIWQACVQRGIDYGEYFEHATKTQMLKPSNKSSASTPPPLAAKRPQPAQPRPLPPPNMHPPSLDKAPRLSTSSTSGRRSSTGSALKLINGRSYPPPSPQGTPLVPKGRPYTSPPYKGGYSPPKGGSKPTSKRASPTKGSPVMSPVRTALPLMASDPVMDRSSRSSWIIAPRKSTDSKALRPYFSSIKKPITRIFARPANYIEAQPTQRFGLFPTLGQLIKVGSMLAGASLVLTAIDSHRQHNVAHAKMRLARKCQIRKELMAAGLLKDTEEI